jgi:hypothetical protein
MTTTKENKTVEAGAILSLRSMKYSTSCLPLYIDAIKVNLTILLDTVKTFAQFVQDPRDRYKSYPCPVLLYNILG